MIILAMCYLKTIDHIYFKNFVMGFKFVINKMAFRGLRFL